MRADAQGFVAPGSSGTASGTRAHAEGNATLASGNYSHAEGTGTQATQSYTHAEGENCVASGGWAHAEGSSSGASGDYSHAEGRSCTASGENSHAQGKSCTASGYCSHAEGEFCQATGAWSHASGLRSLAHRQGQASHAMGQFSATGDAQSWSMELRAETTNATLTNLTSTGGAASVAAVDSNVLTILASKTILFAIRLVARRTDTQDAAAVWNWTEALALRGASGSASLVGTAGGKGVSVNAAAWNAALSIDTTNATYNYLRLDVEGEAAKTIRWLAHVHAVEVG